MPTREKVEIAARAASRRLNQEGWPGAQTCYLPSAPEGIINRALQAVGAANPPPAQVRTAVELKQLPGRGFFLDTEGKLLEQVGAPTSPLVVRPVNLAERLPRELPHFEQALHDLGR